MKLLFKANRYYLLLATPVFLTAGLVFYFMIQAAIREEISEILDFEIEKKIEELRVQAIPLENTAEVEFEIKQVETYQNTRTFQDTVLWDHYRDQWIPYRQITVYETFEEQPYQLTFRESLIESDKLLFAITVSLVLLFILMVLALLMVNYFQVRKLWAGFYENIQLLRSYELDNPQAVKETHSDIQEFQELNAAIRKMTDKIHGDYLRLKEFTENASHEIQTPLAVIKSNLDLLQEEIQQEKAAKIVTKISQGLHRISKINQSLLLLSKIENRQFKHLEKINLKEVISNTLKDFKEMLADKQLSIKFISEEYTRTFPINPALAGILINNLMSNAIKHNIAEGEINIYLDNQGLEFSNTGLALTNPPEKLFERFVKENPSHESSGLGLSLVQKICETYHWKVTYQQKEQTHTIHILF